MPKVNEAHYEKKKQQILEAAKRVCMSKPIYNVAMRDIVIEAEMSQGGVYKYFSNIDEVFVALFNQGTVTHEVKSEIDFLFGQNKEPIDILDDFFQYIGSYIQRSVQGSEKIILELATLYANEPERFLKVKDLIVEVSVLEYLQENFAAFLRKQVEAHLFQPAIPIEDILAFIATSISGITHNALVATHLLENQDRMSILNIDRIIKTMSFATARMLLCVTK